MVVAKASTEQQVLVFSSHQKPLGCLNAALGIIYTDKTADALYLHQEGWRAARSQR